MRVMILLAIIILASCSGEKKDIHNIVTIDLKEASAIEKIPGSPLYWVIEDSGNKNAVYGIDARGKLQTTLNIDKQNTDWESLAADKEGNLYIGDFGNNDNKRKDLKIYKVDKDYLTGPGEAKVSQVIYFNYPEQRDFPPAKSSRLYDCEAFIEHNGNFYLFTKNRSSKSDGTFLVYKLPNRAGNHKAQLVGSLATCEKSSCRVTGADISNNGKTIALLTADAVYLLTNFSENNFSETEMEVLALPHNSQKEGICFSDDNTVTIVDEENKKGGGNMYHVNLKDLKRQN